MKSTFIVVGRKPEDENIVAVISADNPENAEAVFADGLWRNETEERRETVENEGTDHYVELILEIEAGRWRIVLAPDGSSDRDFRITGAFRQRWFPGE